MFSTSSAHPFCQGGASLEGLAFKALLKNMPILPVPGKASSKKSRYLLSRHLVGSILAMLLQNSVWLWPPFAKGELFFSCFCQAHSDSCQQSSSLRANACCFVKCSSCSFLRIWFATCLCSGLLFEETSTMSMHLPLFS